MVRWSPLLAGLLCFAPIAQGDSVHKCISASGVTYQGTPCDGSATANVPAFAASAAISVASTTTRTANTPPCNARPMSTSQTPWRPRALCIGVTDDEVLNLPGWGRPSNIARMRSVRGWQEQWTYVSGAHGPRRLEFVNGKLAAIETPIVDVYASMRVPVASLARTD